MTWRQWAPFWALGFTAGYIAAAAEPTPWWADLLYGVFMAVVLGPFIAGWLSRHPAHSGNRP